MAAKYKGSLSGNQMLSCRPHCSSSAFSSLNRDAVIDGAVWEDGLLKTTVIMSPVVPVGNESELEHKAPSER